MSDKELELYSKDFVDKLLAVISFTCKQLSEILTETLGLSENSQSNENFKEI